MQLCLILLLNIFAKEIFRDFLFDYRRYNGMLLLANHLTEFTKFYEMIRFIIH